MVWKYVLMTSGEITELTRVPSVGCVPPSFRASIMFLSLVVHSVYLVRANECVDFLLTHNVLCLVTLMRCFVSDFAEMLYQVGHLRRVPGRYSNPDEWKTLIEHRP